MCRLSWLEAPHRSGPEKRVLYLSRYTNDALLSRPNGCKCNYLGEYPRFFVIASQPRLNLQSRPEHFGTILKSSGACLPSSYLSLVELLNCSSRHVDACLSCIRSNAGWEATSNGGIPRHPRGDPLKKPVKNGWPVSKYGMGDLCGRRVLRLIPTTCFLYATEWLGRNSK